MEEDEDISKEEKRKPMRVSFSDITSVHFFDRDDDYETPPEKQSSTPQEQVKEFFGPVSLWHIGSESVACSLEHDITLDSTEFSQHFSKLASLETENFRQVSSTPTEESSQENFMILTNGLELNTHPVSVQASNDDDNAEDMNIIGQSPSEFSCATISPILAAPMADTMRQVQSNNKPGYSKLSLGKTSGVMEQANQFTSDFMVDKSEDINHWYNIDLRNEQLTSQGTVDYHELLNSDSSSQVLSNVDTHIPPVCNKVTLSSDCYPLQTRNALLEYCDKGSEIMTSGPVQCTISVSPKTHEPILLPTDNLCHEGCHNSEVSSRVIYPENCQNQQFSGERQGRDTVKTLQPLLSSSSGCVKNNLENLYHWLDGNCDNPVGNILKLKKKHTKECLASVEPSTIDKGSSNATDELEANCKDLTTFCDEPPKCLKNECTDPPFNVELKDQDRDIALYTETCPDWNLSVTCKSTGLARSVRTYSDFPIALSASLANGTISLKRSILSPISLNLEDTRLLSTMTEAKTPRKEHEYTDGVQKGLKTRTDFVNKMSPLSPLIANFSCEQLEQQKIPGHLTPCMSKEPMIMQQDRLDINHKTYDGKYISESDFSTLQADSKGNYGKENRIQILELHDRNPSINIYGNGGLSHEINFEESSIVELSLECMHKRSIHSGEKQTVVETTMDVQKHTEIASAKLIEVPRGCPIGVQGICLPVITKPRSLQQCLSFMYATRPQICLLEDTIEQLQKDITNIKSLPKMKDQLMDEKNLLAVKNKPWLPESFRMGHIKWLQQMLAYEKSKSQLLLTKEDELKKIVQNLQSGFQAVEKLKVKALCLDKKTLLEKQIDWSVKKPAIDDEKKDPIQSLKVDIKKQMKSFASKKADYEGKLKEVQKENLDSCEKIIIMKQELNVLDSRIKDLCEFYSTVCTRNNISKKEIIRSLECNVKSAMKKLLIVEEILLWKVKDIKSKPKEHFMELNYLDIISQRFWIDGDGKSAKASTSYNISYETVERVFPFMSASIAFDVVFSSKQSFKALDVAALWQTVQEMSFLIGSLIDVLQEVQLCRTKLGNLSFARFHCVDGSELHLQLTFLKYTSGLKVVVILDMKDLKSGRYPYDVLPFRVELDQHGQQPKWTLTVEEIEESMKSSSSGYSRLRTLCECLSNIIGCKE